MKKRIAMMLTTAILGGTMLISEPNSLWAMDVAMPVPEQSLTTTEVITRMPLMEPIPPGGSSNPTVSEQEALAILHNVFPDLTTNGEERIYLEQDPFREKTIWRIEVHDNLRPMPTRIAFPTGYRGTVDAETGDVLEMYLLGIEHIEEFTGILSREEARILAEELAQRLHPEKIPQMKFNETLPSYPYQAGNLLDFSYSFSWDRLHNGVVVDNDGIRISINGFTGQVANYHFNWRQDLKLPEAEAPLEVEAFMKQLLEEAGMVITYHLPPIYHNFSPRPTLKPVYQLNSRYGTMVDAVTGDFLSHQGLPMNPEYIKLYDNYAHITGDGNTPAATQPISPAEAQGIAKEFFALLGIEGRVERSGSGSSSGPHGRQEYWSFSVHTANQGNLGSVGIDTATGNIVNYYRHHYSYPTPPISSISFSNGSAEQATTRETALAKAVDFLEKAAPNYANQVVLENSYPQAYMGNDQSHHFRFVRVANGIPLPMDGINIAVSADGQIINYHSQWFTEVIPPLEKVISPEEAAAIWLENSKYTLAYYTPRSFDGRMTTEEAILVYRLTTGGSQFIDAATGQLIDYAGRPLGEEIRSGYNFSGSWAAPALEILAQSGLLPEPAEFQGDTPVTRREAVRVLSSAMVRYYGSYINELKPTFQDVQADDPDLGAIEIAVLLGIVDQGDLFQPNQVLTRQELAVWLINAAGFRDAASIPNRITSPFEDLEGLTNTEMNAVGLVYGLGFMSGDGVASFRPTEDLTWEELAAVILKALPNLLKNTL